MKNKQKWRSEEKEQSKMQQGTRMSGSGTSSHGHQYNFAEDTIGTQLGQSQYPGELFDPSLFGMQNNRASFVPMFYPYSFLPQGMTFRATSTNGLVGQSVGNFAQQHQPPGLPSGATSTNAPVGQSVANFWLQHQPPAGGLSQGLGMNMSYTEMLLAADCEAAYFGSPHTSRYPVGAENETFMITGRNSDLNQQTEMGDPTSNNIFEDNENSNWDNCLSDAYHPIPSVKALTWKDTVPTPGAEFMEALGMCDNDNVIDDDPLSDESNDETTAFDNVLAVSEECADVVVVEDEIQQTENAAMDNDHVRLTPDDIDNFLEEDGIAAEQTSSQQVRSLHVPQMGMVFDTSNAALVFYNQYSSISGFAVRKASNYRG
ncbi:uncharacterized protein LOC125531147 isoform X1 [Triticum urartu]|uniref:uncharacterized protein LOC125531147 isoform X1 n=1 Tax=Triticum urartu TaxID=4572 RepID=UPI002043BE05|nr:uncharacterized protein LOC125531147 isoform X1 [Triticum urartu]